MVDINSHFLRPLLCLKERQLSLLAELDLQSILPKELFEAPKIAGTEQFMAMGVISGKKPSYMHDLESFFWVLFWVCMRWKGPTSARPHATLIQNLHQFRTDVMEDREYLDEVATCSFTAYCKPLISCLQGLHKIFLPYGTYRRAADRALYTQVKTVLEKTREDLKISRESCSEKVAT